VEKVPAPQPHAQEAKFDRGGLAIFFNCELEKQVLKEKTLARQGIL